MIDETEEQEITPLEDVLMSLKQSIDDSVIYIGDSLDEILEALSEGKALDPKTIAILRSEIDEAHGWLQLLNEQLFVLGEHHV